MAKLIIKSRYGVVPDKLLNDPNLSFRAKGLFAYIQSKPDGWRFSVSRIASQTKDGRDSVQSAIKELETAGYLKRVPIKNKEGKWNGYCYILSENPNEIPEEFTDYPLTEKPQTGKPPTENPPTISKTDYSKTDISKTEIDIYASKTHGKEHKTHKKFIDFWHKNCQKLRGVKPIITGKDAKNLKRILDMGILSEDELEQMAIYFLGHYSFKNFAPSISAFLSAGIINGLFNRMKNDENFWKDLDYLTNKCLERKETLTSQEITEKLNQLKQSLSMSFNHQERTKIQEEIAREERKTKSKQYLNF
jgi:hypothetical protein